MIFLSHNWNDKPVVEQMATALAAEFGQHNVFYDSWSIQPGDGIIDKMNEGLGQAKLLFLFVSKNSLESKMVSIEWQNGLYKSVKGDLKIVAVRLDDAPMPAVLMQNVYIDVVNHGLDAAIRQMIDVARGNNTFRPAEQRFQNVRAALSRTGGKLRIEIGVAAYMEPQSRYVILFPAGSAEPSYNVISDGISQGGWNKDVTLDDGKTYDGLLIQVDRATSLNFPVTVEFDSEPPIVGVLRAVAPDRWEGVPVSDPGKAPRINVYFRPA